MYDQLLSSFITVGVLLFLFLWALIIDFLIHLRKRGLMNSRPLHVDRRKTRV